MRILILLALLLCPWTARAAPDPLVQGVVERLILPAFDGFAEASAGLAAAARADCRAGSAALQAAYHGAFDAWAAAAPYRFGPLEQDGRGLAIAFWPDAKGATPRALAGLIAGDGAALGDYAQVSVAARGFFALEAMLFVPEFSSYGRGDPGCRVVQAIAGDLAETATALAAQWRDEFAPLLLSAGAPGNTRFLTAREARQALFTQLLTELEFTADLRLGRPLGTLDRPRPLRAEARASGQSLRQVALSLAAAEALARGLADGKAEALFDGFRYANGVAARLNDPVFSGVETGSGRLKVQELRDAVLRIRDAALAELAPVLGVGAGFNAMDGD